MPEVAQPKDELGQIREMLAGALARIDEIAGQGVAEPGAEGAENPDQTADVSGEGNADAMPDATGEGNPDEGGDASAEAKKPNMAKSLAGFMAKPKMRM